MNDPVDQDHPPTPAPSSTARRSRGLAPDAIQRATSVGTNLADSERLRRLDQSRPKQTQIPLDDITLADDQTDAGVSRSAINPKYIEKLASSIAEYGLFHPLVIDAKNKVICGRHRFHALNHLRTHNPERFAFHFPNGIVPARAYPYERAQDHNRARMMEIIENEDRRDYTPAEIRHIVEMLRVDHLNTRGRPSAEEVGAPRLLETLELIFNKSRATVKRYLKAIDSPETTPAALDQVHLLAPITADLKAARRIAPALRKAFDDSHPRRRDLLPHLTALNRTLASIEALIAGSSIAPPPPDHPASGPSSPQPN